MSNAAAMTKRCTGCDTAPAVPGGGLLPLCEGCKAQLNMLARVLDEHGMKLHPVETHRGAGR